MRRGRLEDLALPDDARDALADFMQLLREEGGERVEGVVLYGSAARGEYGPDSDVDVQVHWRGSEAEARDMLAFVCNEVLARHGALISAQPLDREHRARLRHLRTRFYQTVEAEGVLIG